jgi:ATP-binding cassette subfamily B protein
MRGRLVLAIALLVVAQIVRLAIPWLFGEAVNALQTDGVATASWYLVGMLVAATIAWAMHGPGRILERRVALHARERLADVLFGRVLGLPLRWHEQHHSGETLHRLQTTTAALFGFAQNQFVYLQNFISIVGPIIALLAISAACGGTALAGYLVITVILLHFDREIVRLARDENAAERHYTAGVVDAVANISTVLTLNLHGAVRDAVKTRHLEVSRPLARSFVVNEQKWGAIDLLNAGLRVGLVALYAALSLRDTGTILVGTAVMVFTYTQQLGGVVSSMASNWGDLVRRQTDITSADPILDAPLRDVPALATSVDWQVIRIDDAALTHPNGARGLDGVSLELRRGARIALVGASGAGKSTLLRVLAGLYPADRMRVRVDDREVADLSALAVLVPQEPEIFESDVLANLTLGVPRSEPDIARACQIACLGPVLDALPDGLQARIVERGANLSGGQRQRLALARGLLAASHASLVLLDEPTSSIDPITEARIYDGLLAALPGACVVSSVHRLHLLPRFDTIVLLDAGRVVDTGTLDALIARQPLLREMWRGYTTEPPSERAA